ncbi:hypothetical protein BDM02DRAFT_1758911 [Thelephora ganbajun]|uniref:Uncharacterized protein n=1 Tax=Thelephora ganbajun TaxID=370292 RepID=A0ACB6Z024_THEGA|nr:hypothetical protein BDM02DRAFT_1758911 [Thelephora ganbajun]
MYIHALNACMCHDSHTPKMPLNLEAPRIPCDPLPPLRCVAKPPKQTSGNIVRTLASPESSRTRNLPASVIHWTSTRHPDCLPFCWSFEYSPVPNLSANGLVYYWSHTYLSHAPLLTVEKGLRQRGRSPDRSRDQIHKGPSHNTCIPGTD